MSIIDVEIILLAIIVILSYFLPAILWLFHLFDKSKLSRIDSVQEFKKVVWFSMQKSAHTLNEIKDTLITKEQKARKRLRILFVITLPSLCFLVNVILIKYIGSYYIRTKFNFEMPPTSIFIYIGTLALLSAWTSGVLMNKLLIRRINDYQKKADELEAASIGK